MARGLLPSFDVARCLLAISLSVAPAWGQGLQADIKAAQELFKQDELDAQLHFGYGANYQWNTAEVQEAGAEIAYAEADLRAAATKTLGEKLWQQKRKILMR